MPSSALLTFDEGAPARAARFSASRARPKELRLSAKSSDEAKLKCPTDYPPSVPAPSHAVTYSQTEYRMCGTASWLEHDTNMASSVRP